MEKYLITGYSGFVSRHFLEYLEQKTIKSEVMGIDINKPDINHSLFNYAKLNFERCDLLDKDKVENIMYQFQPDYVVHFASYSSVAFSWRNPVLAFKNNINIFLNLLEVLRECNLNCRVLSIGSSEEYGNATDDRMPLNETDALQPVSPYAVARVSQELLAKVYVNGYGLDIVMTRSFNHIGPGQKDIFVISSFAKQLVEAKISGLSTSEMNAGDVSIVRDFLDVRDAVAAYYLLLHKGVKGGIYNICSGNGLSLKEIIDIMAAHLQLKVDIKTDKKLIRPNDNKIIIGNNRKIKEQLGWKNMIPIEKSLKDILHHWEKVMK